MIEQGSPEWFASRVGKVTASRISDVLAKVKTGESKSRSKYRSQLVAERITGLPCEDGYENEYMRRGKEQEPFARAAYEAATGVLVDPVGLVEHPRIKFAGASPDGMIAPDGSLEIKNPKTEIHLEYIRENRVPPEYLPQILWQQACTGVKWTDFVSFDVRVPEHLRILIVRVPRDEAAIAAMEAEVEKFLAEVEESLRDLDSKEA